MSSDWDTWYAGLPAKLPDEQERFTAILLYNLHRTLETAPFKWGLTGGTAAQSFLPVDKRRYSSDVELITEASEAVVRKWMEGQGWKPEVVAPKKILKAPLTPEGTLFVIHSYDAAAFKAAAPRAQEFQHFPLPGHEPPESVKVPLLDFDYLVATKIYEAWRPDRGGERRKDIHDLSLLLPRANAARVREMLDVYLPTRGAKIDAGEAMRGAGAWMRFALERLAWFENWRNGIVRGPSAFQAKEDLRAAEAWFESATGQSIQLTPWEVVRFMLHDATPKQLAPIGASLGCTGDPTMMKFADCVASKAVPLLPSPPPKDLPRLLELLTSSTKPDSRA
jgi:hypothetical protein